MKARRFVIATLVVSGCAISDEPVSPARDLFVSDYAADAIVRFDGATGAWLATFAAGSEQRVDRPASVTLGPDGQLYAAGFGRGEIVRYERHTGAMMDVFYRDTTLLEEPVELAFVDDELLVLGNDSSSLVGIDRGGRATRAIGYPVMRGAHDFVMVGSRAVVACDQSSELGHAVQIWDLESGALVDHFGTPEEIASATSIAIAGDTIYIADWERGRVVVFDAATHAYRGSFVDGLTGPIAIEIVDDTLFVLDREGLHRFDPETATSLGTFVEARGVLQFPRSFAFIDR